MHTSKQSNKVSVIAIQPYWFVSYLIVDHIYLGILQCGDIAALFNSVPVLQFVRSTGKAIQVILPSVNIQLTFQQKNLFLYDFFL